MRNKINLNTEISSSLLRFCLVGSVGHEVKRWQYERNGASRRFRFGMAFRWQTPFRSKVLNLVPFGFTPTYRQQTSDYFQKAPTPGLSVELASPGATTCSLNTPKHLSKDSKL
jgi:hypothetical protein